MSKYDKKFNQMVLNAYLSGEGGYASLAERFGVLELTFRVQYNHCPFISYIFLIS